MNNLSFDQAVELIAAKDPRYAAAAYGFVREALDHTQAILGRPPSGTEVRHVTCRQLLEGLRDYALKLYGPMAITVLDDWGVHRCEDFGELVFNLIENQVFSKTEQDSREEFKGGYDFDATFRQPFRPELRSVDDPAPTPSPAKI